MVSTFFVLLPWCVYALWHNEGKAALEYASASLQERNEIKAGTLVMHNSHPCATPLSLITKQGLSWNTTRSQLVSQQRQNWDVKPGQAKLLAHSHVPACCMTFTLLQVLTTRSCWQSEAVASSAWDRVISKSKSHCCKRDRNWQRSASPCILQ